MTDENSEVPLSSGWRYGGLFVFVAGFAVRGWITGHVYKVAPPIPERVTNASGAVLFTGQDIRAGQQVSLKYGLMENGTVWGHGAYLGPDFTAKYLHALALGAGAFLSEQQFGRPFADLTVAQRDALKGAVSDLLRKNRYDNTDDLLVFTPPEESCYREQITRWNAYFEDSGKNWGLPPKRDRRP